MRRNPRASKYISGDSFGGETRAVYIPSMRIIPFVFVLSLPVAGLAAMPAFHFQPMPVEPGDPRETLSAVDVDGDGDLDFYSGMYGKAHWFENQGDGAWRRHAISDSSDTDVGAAAADIDGDGRIDRVAGSFWYRNPGAGGGAWTTHRYGEARYVHDLLVADMDADGRPDVVTLLPREIVWFKNPSNPLDTAQWEKNIIVYGEEYATHHGGIAVGDLDGDGDPDVSRLDCWFENPGSGAGTWTRRPGPDFGRDGPWGLTGKALILDMDGDGANDLLQAECDIGNGRVAWFRNLDGKGLTWRPHLFKDSTEGHDFHSLVVADFDGDGDPDVLSIGGSNGSGAPKVFIWERLDPKGEQWNEHLILEGVKGHEAVAGDYDGDGDVDILSKSWGDSFHYLLVNQRIPSSLARAKPPGRAAYQPAASIWRPRFRSGRGWVDPLGRIEPGAGESVNAILRSF